MAAPRVRVGRAAGPPRNACSAKPRRSEWSRRDECPSPYPKRIALDTAKVGRAFTPRSVHPVRIADETLAVRTALQSQAPFGPAPVREPASVGSVALGAFGAACVGAVVGAALGACLITRRDHRVAFVAQELGHCLEHPLGAGDGD